MSKRPAAIKPSMPEDGDAPLRPPPRSSSLETSTSTPPASSVKNTPTIPEVAPSRTRQSEERKAKKKGILEVDPGANVKARAKAELRLASGSVEEDEGSGGLVNKNRPPARQRFPHTMNKAPYQEPSEYTSRDDMQGAFAVNPINGGDGDSMVMDNLIDPRDSAPTAGKQDVVVAAEVASQRDLELQAEASRLRQQIREMQQDNQDVVVVAVPAEDGKSVRPVDEAKQARKILGILTTFCLLVGSIVIGVIFLTPPPPPEPVSDLPCVSESEVFPLGLCMGDCDGDMDCQEGLRCFQRNGGEEVPGCSCGAEDDSRTDYCIEIEYPTVRESDEFPLGLCQGDCDDNSDCQEGLVCFQRNKFTAVPRCSGGETDESNNDYCVEATTMPFLGIFGDRLIGSTDDNFGTSVSLSSDGQILAVGAVALGSTGYVDIYRATAPSNGTNVMKSWIPVAKIPGEKVGEAFGTQVSLSGDGNLVAVGSISEMRGSNGLLRKTASVRVFQASSDLQQWTIIGSEMIGDEYEMVGDEFEFSVDLSPDGLYIAIGQTYSPTGQGTIVFRYDEGIWILLGSPFDGFRTGSGVALSTTASGNLRVAANGENSILGPGQVYVSELGENGEWMEVGQSLGENDGVAIALSDDGTVMALSITNRTSSVGGSGPEHVAVYRLDDTVFPMEWTEMGDLIAIPNGGLSNEPTIALSSDGLLLAIGETWYDDVGRVRILKYNEQVGAWGKFDNDIIGEKFNGLFGAAISLAQSSEESKLAVGAPSSILDRGARGSVSCYQVLSKQDEAADTTFSPTPAPTTHPVAIEEVVFLKGKAYREAIGTSLDLSSDGTSFAYRIQTPDSVDSVRTIKYDALENVWIDLGTIKGDEVGADFGRALALSGDGEIIAIGIPNSNNGTTAGKGRVRVLSYNGTWGQVGTDILPKPEERAECFDGVPVPNSVFCQHSDSNINGGNFGFSISMSHDGSIIAVGSPFGYDEAGQVDIYRFEAGDWVQMGGSIIGPKLQYGKLGWSVSLSSSGLRIAAGAITNGQLVEEAGVARIYEFQDGAWQQIGEDISGQAPRDLFGGAISLSADGNRVAVGSVNNDNENGSNAGHVRVFDYTPETNWTQAAKPLTGLAAGDQFGVSLSLSDDGRKLAVGSKSSSYILLFEYDADNTYWRKIGSPLKRPRETGGGFGASVLLADKGSEGLVFAVGSPSVTTPVQLGQPDAQIGEIHVFEV